MNAKPLVMSALFVISISITKAQNVLLVNGEPTHVSYIGDELTAIHDASPNYMRGYEKPPSDPFTKVEPKLLKNELVIVKQEQLKLGNSKEVNQIDNNNAIFFDKNSAELSESAKALLEEFADELKTARFNSVLLKAWYNNNDETSAKLINARIEQCKEHFESLGIVSNVILSSSVGASNASTFVSVILQ